jgi:predicted naringenin-chalcone synthase
MRIPKVQLLHTNGCTPGSTEAAREALEDALAEMGLPVDVIEVVLVENEKQSREYKMVGGPAIMIDGLDVDPAVRDMRVGGLGCRAYITPEGISQAPPLSMILRALSEAVTP